MINKIFSSIFKGYKALTMLDKLKHLAPRFGESFKPLADLIRDHLQMHSPEKVSARLENNNSKDNFIIKNKKNENLFPKNIKRKL
mmetsp:Transcript_24897/g.24653  ORF Transcript_24897/g.24653 Transcript_24897/m.24653 type:complete len:85 (+) Transcript_24897:93-347(+)